MALHRRWGVMVGLVLALVLAACAPVSGGMGGTEADLVSTQWALVSYGPAESQIQVLPDTEVTLQFEADGQAGGNSGCNAFSAQYEVSNGNLTFGEIVSTLMACSGEGIMDQEEAYLDALRRAETFEMTADRLTIAYANGTSRLTFERLAADGG